MRRLLLAGAMATVLLVLFTRLALADGPLRVVAAGEAPFVVDTPNGVDGLSVRVWARLAEQAGLTYHLERVPTVQAAVEEVAQKRADVAIGPITITARRAKVVSFTLPYYSTTLCIGTPPRAESLWERMTPLVTGILVFLAGVVALLFLVGNIIWFLERHHNSQTFPRAWVPGVANGMWLAVVTMTGVGYGDTVPITGWGRLVAAAWMLLTMLFASTLTASIASMLTEYRLTSGAIDTPRELAGRRVAVVGGSAVVDYANQCHARVIETKDVEAAAALLFAGKADAILFHAPELRYFVQRHPENAMMLSPIHEARKEFGFATAFDSKLAPRLNVALLQLHEEGEIHGIEATWTTDPAPLSLPSSPASPPAASASP